MVISVIFAAIFSDLDPAKSFPLRHAARAISQQLGKLIEAHVHGVSMTGVVAGVVDRFRENQNPLSDYGVHMIRRLLDSGLGVSEITWSQILPTAVAMVPNQAQAVRWTIARIVLEVMLIESVCSAVHPAIGLLPLRRREAISPRHQQVRQDGHPRSRRQDPPLCDGRHPTKRHLRLVPSIDGPRHHQRWWPSSLCQTG